MTDVYSKLEAALGYRFKDIGLLEQSLTHKSYAHEHQCDPNERLEFLGDAILQFMISQLLFDRYPELDEGSLSKFRSALVSEDGLMQIARRLELGQYLKLGKGEDSSGGRTKPSLQSDAVEAVIAACYLDSRAEDNWLTTRDIVARLFDPEIGVAEFKFENIDYKTALQEQVQHRKLGEISYLVLEEKGPDHQKEFKISLQVAGTEYGQAWGSSKKRAEQNAAIIGLKKLQEGL